MGPDFCLFLHRKALYPLIWDVWLSLITVIFWYSDYLVFVQNSYISWLLSYLFVAVLHSYLRGYLRPLASLVAQTIKILPAVWEAWVQSWIGKIPWRKARQTTPVFLPGESPWTEEPGGLQSKGSWVQGVVKCWTWLSNYTQQTSQVDILTFRNSFSH